MNVDYKELYISVQRQIGDLSLMVDKYQNEIIPQYEQLLKAARAERDDTKAERDAALEQLKKYTTCLTCKKRTGQCDCDTPGCKCGANGLLWEWAGPKEAGK